MAELNAGALITVLSPMLEGGRERKSVRVYGCSPGCIALSLAASLLLTVLVNVLIRLL